jgi:hypothetical protein
MGGAGGNYEGGVRRLKGFGGILRERVHLEDLDVDRMVLLKLIFNERNGRAWT